MEIRQMPAIQEIAEYLRNMTFKRKWFGGCDLEDVLDHFSDVTQKYELVISTLLMQLERNAGPPGDFDQAAAETPPSAQWANAPPFDTPSYAQNQWMPQPQPTAAFTGGPPLTGLDLAVNQLITGNERSDLRAQSQALDTLLDELFGQVVAYG